MVETILSKTRDHMKKALDVSRHDLSTVRSGRATPALIDHIVISAYGGTQRLKVAEMATITIQDAKTIVISPYDPSVTSDIEKGILEANIGLTPVADSEIIRISIPPLSEERRKEYIKLARAKLEAGRIMVRQVRAEAMKDLKKAQLDSTVSEDEQKYGEKRVQELTDEMIAELDAMEKKKEEELMQV